MGRSPRVAAVFLWLSLIAASAQVIEFESGGLKYQTLTKNGITVMVASLPAHIKEWSVVQVAVSNGSPIAWTIKPEDFSYQKQDGQIVHASPARSVVDSLIAKASRSDVIKLVTAYETGLYGLQKFKSTHGYEERRQAAFAEVSSARIKAAAAASAIAFVSTRLAPGQSTDGAVFYPAAGKTTLGPGRLVLTALGERFEFEPEMPVHNN